ncbi:hypothetical protein HED49_09615 [Ochrobactrum daejeonense]|nr:hypothetical protein [Brucella daejeonensis]
MIAAPSAVTVKERFNIFTPISRPETLAGNMLEIYFRAGKGHAVVQPVISPVIVTKFKKIRAISTHRTTIPCAMLNEW